MKKLNQQEYDKFIKQVNFKRADPSWLELRLGQIMYNTLHGMYPDIAAEIAATEFDPFYVDSRIQKFLERIRE